MEKELAAARELSSRSSGNGGNRKHNDVQRPSRRGRLSGRSNDVSGMVNDGFDLWNVDPEDMKLEVQARKLREAALEAALAEKEALEDEYRKKMEEAKKREAALENDLANMWVRVAQLKKERDVLQVQKTNMTHAEDKDEISVPNVDKDPPLRDTQTTYDEIKHSDIRKEEPLVVRLKVSYCYLVSRTTSQFATLF